MPSKPTLTVFALAELRGQIGPCGCTSDPLGDISRTVELVTQARSQGPVLVVDAGSTLYSDSPVPPHLAVQEELKADLIADIYKSDLQVAALGLGPMDLAKGPDELRMPRVVANTKDLKEQPYVLSDVGGAKVGTFSVIAEDAIKGLAITDPVAAGKAQVQALRQQGAQVVVALVQASSKRDAVKLVKDIGGIDFTIAGLGLDAPEPDRISIEPEKVGDGWLVIPANRGQVVSRLDLYVRGGSPFADAVGQAAASAKLAMLDKQLVTLDADLAKFKADTSADPTFIKQKEGERAQLAAQRDALKAHPLVVPARGSFFTLDQIRINKTLACSVPTLDKVKHYDVTAGEANVKAAAGRPVPAPAKGEAHYVGMAACEDCHQDAVDFWKKTVHAQAWQTLVDRGQQFDMECINCHVTGWDKPGGSNLAHNDNLRDVQCEVCHGPASIHVAKGGDEKPSAVKRMPAQDLCATNCHTHEHSDTFQYEAYLRDIVGPGHGEDLRKKLGNGPTGHELRKAALDKAGRTLGAGCTR
ncbi:MAG TPA: multiheme c-type cytochrome [Kofleriaceae bacterium]|nr:multiheme c-type cytochrome [Kofleriaceae bacterium]